MSLKSYNENKIWYKQMNKNLTINNEWQYSAIHDCCTRETMKIFERRKLLPLSSNQNMLFFSVPSERQKQFNTTTKTKASVLK